MAGTPYLVDSNVLLRWVKPDDRDYPLVVSAIDATLQRGAVFCYTSQNVAEFWNTCTRPLDRNGYGLSPQEADRRARFFEDKLRLLPDSLAVHQRMAQTAGCEQCLRSSCTRCAIGGCNASTRRRQDSDVQRQGLRSLHRHRSRQSSNLFSKAFMSTWLT